MFLSRYEYHFTVSFIRSPFEFSSHDLCLRRRKGALLFTQLMRGHFQPLGFIVSAIPPLTEEKESSPSFCVCPVFLFLSFLPFFLLLGLYFVSFFSVSLFFFSLSLPLSLFFLNTPSENLEKVIVYCNIDFVLLMISAEKYWNFTSS